MAAIVAYWPAIVAGLYLLYVLAAAAGGSTSAQGQIPAAVSAFVAVLGAVHNAAGAKSLAKAVHAVVFPEPNIPPAKFLDFEQLPHRD